MVRKILARASAARYSHVHQRSRRDQRHDCHPLLEGYPKVCSAAKSWLSARRCGQQAEAKREGNMHALFHLLLLISAVALVACIVWLHWRALQDGAIHDVLLFLTGVSIFSYIFSRWDRAKPPILGIVGAAVLLAIGASVSSSIGWTSHEPSPDQVAAEVKPLILQEWKKQPGLRNATIQRISLTHKGGGVYSGFIEAALDGQPERLALEVVLDHETIRWEIKAEAN
jgi:hypothetical protein